MPPNSLGEYRTHLTSVSKVETMLAFFRDHDAWPSGRSDRRFASVNASHILSAARWLAAGYSPPRDGPSTDYDALFDGLRLAPKAVFSLAASDALRFPVQPENFRGGEGITCFRVLRRCGYEIVAKGAGASHDQAYVSFEDRSWAEG